MKPKIKRSAETHEQRILRVLTTAYQKIPTPLPWQNLNQDITPTDQANREIEEMINGDGSEEDHEFAQIRKETLHKLAEFFLLKGSHPGTVLRRIYMYLQRTNPDLILNMNSSELAEMFGETRAAWSARNKKYFENFLVKHGSKAPKARWQKSETCRQRLAVAARGNANRLGKRMNHAAGE